MKRIVYSFLLLFFTLTFAGFAQSQELNTKLLQGHDSLISNKFDTLARSDGYQYDYKKDRSVVDIFSPYFVKDICEPGNYNHQLYKDFVAKSNELASKSFELLSIWLERESKREREIEQKAEVKRKLGGVASLANCRLVVLPVYYLTANVVNLSDGENINRYFTLDTSRITYQLLKGTEIIALISNKGDQVWKLRFSPDESLSYYQVKGLGKEPIGINTYINIPQVHQLGEYPSLFGYVTKGQLVLSRCSQGDYIRQTSKGEQNRVFKRTCTTILANSYFSTSPSFISQAIESVQIFLKKKKINLQ